MSTGSYTTNKVLAKARKGNRPVTDVEMAGIKKRDSRKFYCWVLLSLSTMGDSANRQLYLIQEVFMFKGMSLTGCGILQKLGMSLSRKSFMTRRTAALGEQVAKVER